MSKRLKETKQVREHKRVAEACGAHLARFHQNGHYQLTLEYHGHEKMFVVAGTPSDVRSLWNFRGSVKKWVEEVDGLPN